MTDTEKKVKNIFTYLIPLVLSSIMPFFTFPIITRCLDPKDFGIAALALSSVTLIFNAVACCVDYGTQLYYFKYRKNSNDLRSLINSGMTFLLAVIIISIFAVYLFSGFISKVIMGTKDYCSAIVFAYASVCFSGVMRFYLQLYRNMEKAKHYSFFQLSHAIISAALALILIAGYKIGFMGLIYSAFYSSLIVSIVLFLLFIREFPYKFEKKFLKEILKYGIQVTPTLFTGSIYKFFDKYMLRTIISFASTGIYSIAQNISNKLFIFMTAVQSTFVPLFMKDLFDKGKDGAKSFARNFTVFTYLSLSAVLLLILFGEELIILLAPPNYYNAINVMLILLCSVSTQTFAKVVGLPLEYKNKAYLFFPISMVGVIMNVLLNILLIPRWGAAGAGIATLFTQVIIISISYSFAQKHFQIAYEKNILILFYANLFLTSMILIFLRRKEVAFMFKYAVKLVSLGLFVFAGIKANIVSKKNINILFNILKFGRTVEGRTV